MTTYLIGPDGKRWALVCAEPTLEMLNRGTQQHTCEQADPWYGNDPITSEDCRAVFSAMLAAAPDFPRDELVEKVARSSYDRNHQQFGTPDFDLETEEIKAFWREDARAVLAAIMGEVSDEDLAR